MTIDGNLATAQPAPGGLPSPERDAPRRHLEIVTTPAQRRARPRTVYAIGIIAGIFAILIVQLLLSIALADGAVRITALQGQERELARAESDLTEQLEVFASTQNLTANAGLLGMVPSGNPAFLDLETGTVVGSPGQAGSVLDNTHLIVNVLVDESMMLVPAGAAERASESAEADDAVAAVPPAESAAPVTAPQSELVSTSPVSGVAPPLDSPGSVSSEPGLLPSPVTR